MSTRHWEERIITWFCGSVDRQDIISLQNNCNEGDMQECKNCDLYGIDIQQLSYNLRKKAEKNKGFELR
jgi:hypothetical protein